MAASIAVPPSSSISIAVRVARGCDVAAAEASDKLAARLPGIVTRGLDPRVCWREMRAHDD